MKDATDLDDDDLLEAHMSLKENSSEKCTQWKCPAFLDGNLELDNITEPTMHDFSLSLQKLHS